MDQDESIRPDHAAALLARGVIGAHDRADRHAVVTDDFAGDEADPLDVRVTVLPAEAEPLREVRADDVSIEERHLAPVFLETRDQRLGDRRFPGAAEARQPHAAAARVARRLTRDRRRHGQRERDAGPVSVRGSRGRRRADLRQHQLEDARARGLNRLAAGIDLQGRTDGRLVRRVQARHGDRGAARDPRIETVRIAFPEDGRQRLEMDQ